jgi:hypothetical protein
MAIPVTELSLFAEPPVLAQNPFPHRPLEWMSSWADEGWKQHPTVALSCNGFARLVF